jgi:hypothetical protein
MLARRSEGTFDIGQPVERSAREVVLALFGEQDRNVDWRQTRALYTETIGRNPRARLTVKTSTSLMQPAPAATGAVQPRRITQTAAAAMSRARAARLRGSRVGISTTDSEP